MKNLHLCLLKNHHSKKTIIVELVGNLIQDCRNLQDLETEKLLNNAYNIWLKLNI